MRVQSFLPLGLFFALLFACKKADTPSVETCLDPGIQYYSDYFVFVANDGGSRLVIPLDLNWSPNDTGYSEEFKCWHGTSADWPIAYYVNGRSSKSCDIPQEAWQHQANEYFSFDEAGRTLTANVPNAPQLKLYIPEAESWVKMPDDGNNKSIYAFETTAWVGGTERKGWMIYERIRRKPSGQSGGGRDFAAFFWIPLVVNGDFYYFQDHKGEQSAARWLKNQSGKVETLSSFTLDVIQRESDSASGRSNIPEILHIKATSWILDITLKSTGAQVGYGPSFPNGLAYYRQSLLEPTDSSKSQGYGMLELILEND